MKKTHDYSIKTWGRSYEILSLKDKGKEVRLAGWGTGIKPKDFILLRNGADSTRYQITTIEYQNDPVDMWFADATFSPRTKGELKE